MGHLLPLRGLGNSRFFHLLWGLTAMDRVTVSCEEDRNCYRIWIHGNEGRVEHLDGFKYKDYKERYRAWMDCLREARKLEIQIEESDEDL